VFSVVAFADGSEEGRDGHEAAGLIQSCHVERNPGNVSASIYLYLGIIQLKRDAPNQRRRRATPETMYTGGRNDCSRRGADHAALPRTEKDQSGESADKCRVYFVSSAAPPS
jgi:hypothetical protein